MHCDTINALAELWSPLCAALTKDRRDKARG